MVREGDAETVRPDFPVQRRGDRFEVREEGYADLEGGEFGGGDGVEAGVV